VLLGNFIVSLSITDIPRWLYLLPFT